MSVISILTILLVGWLIYHALQPNHLELSPASLTMVWVLGTGGIYLIYYGFVGFLHQNPPSILILVIGALGIIDILRIRHKIMIKGWDTLRKAKFSVVILGVIMVMMSISIFMSGFYADTTRMWLAKGDMLNQLPDYIHLMEALPDPRHPDYPMVMSHQYQWQLVWADDWMSLKLSTWVWYIALLLAALPLFSRDTRHPVRWLIVLAGYPAYWFVVPIATVDIPLSVMWLIVIGWALQYLDGDDRSPLAIALVCGMITLTKNEGFLIVGSIVIGLLITLLIQPAKRRDLIHLLSMIIIVSGLSFFSWYGVIVPQADITIASDFGLSGFTLERIPQVIEIIAPILFNPVQTAGLWLIFLYFIVRGYHQKPLLWLPALLYLVFISASYTFSVRDTSLLGHIIQSYFRLILQITPLALVYVAGCFAQNGDSPKVTNSADTMPR